MNNLSRDFDDLLEMLVTSLPEIGACGCLAQDSNFLVLQILLYLPHKTSPTALHDSDGLSVPLAQLIITVCWIQL